jgi:hypothetical protein
MAFYRKKPVVIEAHQWNGSINGATAIIDWALSHGGTIRYHDEVDALAVDTTEGTMTVQPDDWIVKGVMGEFYPVKPTVFDVTYEPEGVRA